MPRALSPPSSSTASPLPTLDNEYLPYENKQTEEKTKKQNKITRGSPHRTSLAQSPPPCPGFHPSSSLRHYQTTHLYGRLTLHLSLCISLPPSSPYHPCLPHSNTSAIFSDGCSSTTIAFDVLLHTPSPTIGPGHSSAALSEETLVRFGGLRETLTRRWNSMSHPTHGCVMVIPYSGAQSDNLNSFLLHINPTL